MFCWSFWPFIPRMHQNTVFFCSAAYSLMLNVGLGSSDAMIIQEPDKSGSPIRLELHLHAKQMNSFEFKRMSYYLEDKTQQ